MAKKESAYALKQLIVKNDEPVVNGEWEIALKLKKTKISFIHLTYTDVVNKIIEEGFKAGDGNMGIGVYCCDLESPKSIQALIHFQSDLSEGEDEMCLITGTYEGEFLECIGASDEHHAYNIGFVLLKDLNKIQVKQTLQCPSHQIEKELRKYIW